MTACFGILEKAFPPAMTMLVMATVVLLAAIVVHRTISQSPAIRHAVLLIALVTIGLCPIMVVAARLAPARALVFLPNPSVFDALLSHSQSAVASQNDNRVLSPSHFPFAEILLVLWAAGALISFARLICGLHTMGRVRRSATPDARIVPMRLRLASALGGNVPEIRVSDQVRVPVALGCLRPIVLLPSSFLTRFNDHQVFQILVHECAHALRRDALVGLYQRLLAGTLWFHPLIYVANRLLDRAREEVCDNYVLQGVISTEYSRTLLMVAQSLSPLPNGWFAPTLVHSRLHLQDRVAGLLNPRRCIMTRVTSKTIAIVATGFIVGALVLSCFAAAPTDEAAVRATVADYIEGYYTGDASRMEKSLHPHYLKHTISGSDGQLRMTERTGLQMVQDVRSHGSYDLPISEKKEQITVLDVAGDVASAKLVTTHWVDYITLSKWNGEWKIVSVVLRETD
jgi:beta-lactamase regulating signal transducer with metallopeptidase domain